VGGGEGGLSQKEGILDRSVRKRSYSLGSITMQEGKGASSHSFRTYLGQYTERSENAGRIKIRILVSIPSREPAKAVSFRALTRLATRQA